MAAESFDRDRTAEARIPRAIHLTETARTERTENLECAMVSAMRYLRGGREGESRRGWASALVVRYQIDDNLRDVSGRSFHHSPIRVAMNRYSPTQA